jgi:hypothetical protein
MKILHHQRKLFRFFYLASCAFILMLLCIIPVRLAIAYYQHPNPQAILTLGGGSDREKFTAQFAQAHPSLKSGFPLVQSWKKRWSSFEARASQIHECILILELWIL